MSLSTVVAVMVIHLAQLSGQVPDSADPKAASRSSPDLETLKHCVAYYRATRLLLGEIPSNASMSSYRWPKKYLEIQGSKVNWSDREAISSRALAAQNHDVNETFRVGALGAVMGDAMLGCRACASQYLLELTNNLSRCDTVFGFSPNVGDK